MEFPPSPTNETVIVVHGTFAEPGTENVLLFSKAAAIVFSTWSACTRSSSERWLSRFHGPATRPTERAHQPARRPNMREPEHG